MFHYFLIIKIGKTSVTTNTNINQCPNYCLHSSSSPSCQIGQSHLFSSPCSCSSSFPCSCFFFSPCFGSFFSLCFCFSSAFALCFDFSLFSPCSYFSFSPSPLFSLDPSSQALFSFPSSLFR